MGAASSALARAQELQDQNFAKQDHQKQLQIAPLSQALSADRVRLASFVDPKTLKPLPGHEQDYDTTLDRMASTIGQMRTLMGDKAPADDPGRLKSAAARLLDATHITRDLHGHIQDTQTRKANAYAAQNKNLATASGEGVVPFEMTDAYKAEQQKGDQAVRAAEARGGNLQPRVIGRTSAKDAIHAQQVTGQKYFTADGDEITADQLRELPDYMALVTVQRGKDTYYDIVDQRASTVTAGNVVSQKPELGGIAGSATPLGPSKTPTSHTSKTTDPFGVTSTTQSTTTPQTPGMTTPPAATPGLKTRPNAQSTPQTPSGPKTQQLHAQVRTHTRPATQSSQLDANGHIPETAEPNSNLREAANQLLDGMDINKLNVPARDKQAAAHLASQYGWEQGKFTPREMTQVQESQQLIKSMTDTPGSLDAYNEGALKRGLLAKLIYDYPPKSMSDAAKEALISKVALTDKDVTFIQNMRQLIGRIQGLAQLTRGSGRPTEQSVKRMMAELPDPRIVSSPEQAKHAFDLINNEIDIATQKPSGGKSQGPKTKQVEQTKSLDERLNAALEGH